MREPTKLEKQAFIAAKDAEDALAKARAAIREAWPQDAELQWRGHDGRVRRGRILQHCCDDRLRVVNLDTAGRRKISVRQIKSALEGARGPGR